MTAKTSLDGGREDLRWRPAQEKYKLRRAATVTLATGAATRARSPRRDLAHISWTKSGRAMTAAAVEPTRSGAGVPSTKEAAAANSCLLYTSPSPRD